MSKNLKRPKSSPHNDIPKHFRKGEKRDGYIYCDVHGWVLQDNQADSRSEKHFGRTYIFCDHQDHQGKKYFLEWLEDTEQNNPATFAVSTNRYPVSEQTKLYDERWKIAEEYLNRIETKLDSILSKMIPNNDR